MLRRIASLIAILLVAVIALTGWVVGTEAGGAWLAREAGLLTGGAVHIEGIHGTLASGIEADEVTIRAGAATINGHGVVLRLVPAALLRGWLEAGTVRARRVAVAMTPAPSSGEPFRMPRVATPIPVRVEDLSVDVLEFRRGETVQTISGIRFAGSLRQTRLRVHHLQGALAGLGMRAAGSARLEPELPVEARVEWRLADPEVSGAGTVRGQLATLEIAQIIRVPDDVRLSATVSDLASGARAQVNARWESLRFNVPGLGPVRVSAGNATLEGTVTAWKATAAAAAQAEALPPMQVHATARGDRQRIVFDDLRLDGRGTLSAQGELELTPARRLRLDVTATAVDTAALRRGLEGSLSGRATLDVSEAKGVQVAVSDLRGRLMGRPLTGAGKVGYRDRVLTFSDVGLRAGPNRLQADGSMGDRLAGRFDLQAPDLSVLWPGLAGQLDAHATLAGTRKRPVVELDARGQRLALPGLAVQEFELRGRVDPGQRVHADLSARAIEYGAKAIGNLDASVEGTVQAHRLTAQLTGGLAEVRLASAGGWDGTTLLHRVESASVETRELGVWRLSGEPVVAVRRDAATIGDHCWEQEPTSLCLSGLAWSPARTQLTADLRRLDLQRFNQWLRPDLALAGTAYAAATLELTASGLTGSAIWRQEDTTLRHTGSDEVLVTPLETAQVAANFTPGAVLATLELDAGGGLHLAGSGSISGPVGRDAALDMHVAGQLPDIAPLVLWLAGDLDLAEVAGKLTLDAAVAGTLAAPTVTGEMRLSGGAVAMPDLGMKVDAIDVALRGDGGPALKLKGSATAGGALTLDGEIRPIAQDGPEGWVRIRGTAVDAVRLPDRYLQATPDITLRYAQGQLATEGGVTIPKAEIVVRKLPESAASPSRDAVVRDSEGAGTTADREVIGGELAVTLGRDVHLKAFGLDTFVEGTVKISQGADGEAKGYGVLRLREGKFGAYGKELIIERGTLGFAGPLDDPTIDLRATRRIDWEGRSITAGILVSGTAIQPESRVFSDPVMSDADALSYLVSGRPMQSANATDRSAVAGAALSLGVQQTSPITQAIGSAVTLDELGVEGGTLDETQIVAGKQVGSDLYVRFAYGLFNRVGSVLARYRIGRGVSIEASSGEDQSLDLIYSVEKP